MEVESYNVCIVASGLRVAQMEKNLLAMQEIWVQSLGWGDPLEEGRATHASILAWKIPMDRRVRGVAKMWLSN